MPVSVEIVIIVSKQRLKRASEVMSPVSSEGSRRLRGDSSGSRVRRWSTIQVVRLVTVLGVTDNPG
jgi:hypothetical protein